MEDLLISVCSPPEIDADIYCHWIDGFTPDEVAKITPFRGNCFEFSFRIEESSADMMRMFQFDIEDQFRCYEILEHYLMQPYLLRSQTVCTISPELHSLMIEKYWGLDDSFIRELLNKKLTKSRKDLEDASENTGLHLRSVMRQFDNIKRIYAAYEDTTNLSGNAFQFISKNYMISPALVKKYTCLIYLMDSKFNLTSKKRLLKVPYLSLETSAAVTMSCLNVDASIFVRILQGDALADPMMFLENTAFVWSYIWRVFPSIEQFEVDKQLLTSLRDLRTVLTGEILDNGCSAVRNRLSSNILRKLEGSVSFGYSSSTKLRNIIKGLLTIGSNLSQTKEFRDLYEDILTKVAEPLEECGVTPAEMGSIMSACYFAAQEIPDKGGNSAALINVTANSSSVNSNINGMIGGNSGHMSTNLSNTSTSSNTNTFTASTSTFNSNSINSGNNVGSTGNNSNTVNTGNMMMAGGSGNSMRSSDGITSRSDMSTPSQMYGSINNATNNNSNNNSATSNSGGYNYAGQLSTRIPQQSRAYYMRADWLRFLIFCKLTLTELLVTDRRV